MLFSLCCIDIPRAGVVLGNYPDLDRGVRVILPNGKTCPLGDHGIPNLGSAVEVQISITSVLFRRSDSRGCCCCCCC